VTSFAFVPFCVYNSRPSPCSQKSCSSYWPPPFCWYPVMLPYPVSNNYFSRFFHFFQLVLKNVQRPTTTKRAMLRSTLIQTTAERITNVPMESPTRNCVQTVCCTILCCKFAIMPKTWTVAPGL